MWAVPWSSVGAQHCALPGTSPSSRQFLQEVASGSCWQETERQEAAGALLATPPCSGAASAAKPALQRPWGSRSAGIQAEVHEGLQGPIGTFLKLLFKVQGYTHTRSAYFNIEICIEICFISFGEIVSLPPPSHMLKS